MANNHFTCPHCGGQVKTIPIGKPASISKRNIFEHTIPQAAHRGLIKGLWFHVFKRVPIAHPPSVPRTNDMTLQIETWNHTERKVNFDHLDTRITVGIARDIAHMIIDLGEDWTRGNLVRHTCLSENKTRVVVSEFKRLGYIEVSDNNRTIVTSQGRRFLRGVLSLP